MNNRIWTAAALLAGFYCLASPARAAEFGDAQGIVEEARARGAQYGPGILISEAKPLALQEARDCAVEPCSSSAQPAPEPAPFAADAAISIQDPAMPSSWKWPGSEKQGELQSSQRCFRSQWLSLAVALKSPSVLAAATAAKPGASKLHVWFYYASDTQSGPDAIRPVSIAVDWIFDDGTVKRSAYEAGLYGVEAKTLTGRIVGPGGVYQLAGYSGPSGESDADGAILCRVEPYMIAGPLQ